MSNAINNSLYKIMRETTQNFQGRPKPPSAQCPQCGATMYLQVIGDGRMGQFQCGRCRYKQIVRIG